MKGRCDICGEISDNLEIILINNEDTQKVCPQCYEDETNRIEMSWENQGENRED